MGIEQFIIENVIMILGVSESTAQIGAIVFFAYVGSFYYWVRSARFRGQKIAFDVWAYFIGVFIAIVFLDPRSIKSAIGTGLVSEVFLSQTIEQARNTTFGSSDQFLDEIIIGGGHGTDE